MRHQGTGLRIASACRDICRLVAVALLPFIAAGTTERVSTALKFNSSIWDPNSEAVEVIVIEHLDLTELDVSRETHDHGTLTEVYYAVSASVQVIRGGCQMTQFDHAGLTTDQCHISMPWGYSFALESPSSLWIDRLYIENVSKPTVQMDATTHRPSVTFQIGAGSELWVTRTTVVGTAAALAVDVHSGTQIEAPGRVCISNSTITNFSSVPGWGGPIVSAGLFTLEDTIVRLESGAVEARAPVPEDDVAIIDMRGVTLDGNVFRFGQRTRVASDNPEHSLTFYNQYGTYSSGVAFDVLTQTESDLLITLESENFTEVVEVYGWDPVHSPPSPPPYPPMGPSPDPPDASGPPVASPNPSGGPLSVVLIAAVLPGLIFMVALGGIAIRSVAKHHRAKQANQDHQCSPVCTRQGDESGSCSASAGARIQPPGQNAPVSEVRQFVYLQLDRIHECDHRVLGLELLGSCRHQEGSHQCNLPWIEDVVVQKARDSTGADCAIKFFLSHAAFDTEVAKCSGPNGDLRSSMRYIVRNGGGVVKDADGHPLQPFIVMHSSDEWHDQARQEFVPDLLV